MSDFEEMEGENISLFDVQPAIWLGYNTILDAFHHLMDQHYDGAEGRNPWVVVELKSGHFEVMTEREADSSEEVVEFYILSFNPNYSVTLVAWSTGEDFLTILEGK